MKRIFLMLAVAALFAGCSQTERSKIVRNYEAEYNFNTVAVNSSSQALYFKNTIAPELEAKISKYLKQYSDNFLLRLRIFINENGEVDFVKFVKEPRFMKDNPDIEEDIVGIIEKVPLVKIEENGKTIKSAFEITVKSGDLFVSDEYLVAVDKMPQIRGGVSALAKNIHYPEEAKKAGVQGRVFITAYIDENGNVVKAEVLKGIGHGCDKAALNAVKKVKFTPGEKNGKPVKTRVTIPVSFNLK